MALLSFPFIWCDNSIEREEYRLTIQKIITENHFTLNDASWNGTISENDASCNGDKLIDYSEKMIKHYGKK